MIQKFFYIQSKSHILGKILTLATSGHPRFHFFVESKEDLLRERIFRHHFELHNRTKHKHNPC